MQPKYRMTCALIMVALPFLGCGKPAETCIQPGADTPLPQPIVTCMNERKLQPANVGFILYDPAASKVVMSHNRSELFIPASTSKLATTLAALEVLGPDFQFDTILGRTGDIVEGELKGDIYLKGTGDPQLSVTDLMAFVEKCREAGIRRVSGHFYFDQSAFGAVEQIDKGMGEDAQYNPGVSALSLDYNTIHAQWGLERGTRNMKVYLTPSLPTNAVELAPRELPDETRFSLQKTGALEKWLLTPTVRWAGRDDLPVRDPGQFTAEMFARLCQINGITLPRPEPGVMPSSADTIHVLKSASLSSLVEVILTYSNNVMAELVTLRTAEKLAGRIGSLDEAARVVGEYIVTHIQYPGWEGFYLKNGSGLSSMSRISPEQMLAILAYADTRRYNDRTFMSYLPISGWKWSLMTRLNDPDAAFHVWAKTGTINYSLGLSGYLYTNAKKRMIFSIFVTDYAERAKFEANPRQRSRDSQRKAYRWIEENKDGMDAIVAEWIKNL